MNRKMFRVMGMTRSGIHPVVEWIKASYVANGFACQFDNRIQIEYPNTIAKFLPMKPDEGDSERFLWLVEHEDVQFTDMPELREKLFTNFDVVDVLVVRDVFNTMASRFKVAKHLHSRRNVNVWKSYAYEALGRTSFLGPKKVVVNFNSWVDDMDYRRKMAGQLGILEMGADTSKQVPPFSAFDNPEVKVADLKLNERWVEFIPDKDFWGAFDKDVLKLNTELFGGVDERITAKLSTS